VTRPAEIVERYFAAWTTGDFETARTLLADDLAFVGPFDTFDRADDLIGALRGLASSSPAPSAAVSSPKATT
jgi:ketosteroid isomerase-like protein